jgi:hypothetical protein
MSFLKYQFCLIAFFSCLLFGCEQIEPLKEEKANIAINMFRDVSELNDIQKLLLFEYLVNDKTYQSQAGLRSDYGDVQSLVEEEVVGVQSIFEDGKLSLYVDVSGPSGSTSIGGIIFTSERLDDLRRRID